MQMMTDATLLPPDILPDLLPPRGYVPAADAPDPGATPYDAVPALDQVGASDVERLYASAWAARARMDAPAALAFVRAGLDAGERFGAGSVQLRRLEVLRQAVRIEHPTAAGAADDGVPAPAPLDAAAPRLHALALTNDAIAAALAGDTPRALRMFDAAADLAEGDPYARLMADVNRARALIDVGELREAGHEAASALRLARREKRDDWTAVAGFASALAHLARGRRNEARARLGESVRTFAREGQALRQIECHFLLGEIAYVGEDPIRAGTHYRDALGVARAVAAQEWIELLTLRFEHR
jgi:tetratricopeptide (TPR) repeat protein